MKKTKVREWTCDRCGKTIESKNRIIRPFGMGKSRIRIEIGLYYYENKQDLCYDCANELVVTIRDYLRK